MNIQGEAFPERNGEDEDRMTSRLTGFCHIAATSSNGGIINHGSALSSNL